MVNSILDDTLDETLFYQLANIAKNKIEDSRPWMMLRAVDSSLSTTTGNNSTTARALPAAWRRTYKLMVGRDQEVMQVPFDEQHLWRNSSNHFCIDVANSVYYLLGAFGAPDTIYHYYIKTTTDIAAGTSPVWPERFHGLIAFEVASYIMGGQDADEQFARMSPVNLAAHTALLNAMEAWDFNLQLSAQNNQVQVANQAGGIELGMM